MRDTAVAAIAANRFGLGARPGELAALESDPRGWLTAQLRGAPPVIADPALRDSAAIVADLQEIRRSQRQVRAQAAASNEPVQAFMKIGQLYRPIYLSEATLRLRTAVQSERPFIERLTHFWTNHFAVSVDKVIVLGLAGSLEREAIRPHVLGTFADMLLAVERHPAMLLYLDNAGSIGPHSLAGMLANARRGKGRIGINENLAREILELHTLGVDGGYTQADVTTFAQVISGWSIGGGLGRLSGGTPGHFMFRPALHEPGAKILLGKRYAEDGVAQGETVLRDLAASPATARHIAMKLARHFVADEPPAPIVEHLAHVYLQTGGDLPKLYGALIDAREPWQRPLAKYKTPAEYVISTYRALELPVVEGRGALAALDQLGQRTYGPGSPAGWPDRSADWDGASALLKRIEWVDMLGQKLGARHDARELAPQLLGATLSEATRTALAHAASAPQALTLLLAAPEFLRR
jgi:uncharacterized protein (DUF1800 family)